MNALVSMNRHRGLLVLAVSVLLAGCNSSDAAGPTPSESAFPESREVNDVSGPLERGTYHVDPDGDPSTPMRVHLTIPADGWSPPTGNWRGVGKDFGSEERELVITITTVANVAQDGCTSDAPADPPVGPGVDDLADALAALPPFGVTSAPSDVTAYGYKGKHLELTVPDITGCFNGNAFSWIEVGYEDDGPFYGYGITGTVEELWILDVDGTRLMIAAMRRPGATPQDLAEMEAILNSIRIEA